MDLELLLWIPIASLSGYVVTNVGAGTFRLSRNRFLLLYVPVAALLIAWFYSWSQVSPAAQAATNWLWGLGAGVVAAIVAIRHVVVQKAYPRRQGGHLAVDILWPGMVYGFVDGMVLSVVPVTAVHAALHGTSLTFTLSGRLVMALAAFAASMVVTLFYHWGYPEYKGKRVLMTLVGNGVFTLTLLLTGNILAAVLPHMAMHVAAVWHGRETTYQLPPHYRNAVSPLRGER